MSSNYEGRLIDLIQPRPYLFSKKHPDYRDTKKKNNAWDEIAKEVQIGIEECKARWKTLRDTFARIHSRIKKAPSGAGAKASTSDWQFYPSMMWYAEYMIKRSTTTNDKNEMTVVMNMGSDTSLPTFEIHNETTESDSSDDPQPIPVLSERDDLGNHDETPKTSKTPSLGQINNRKRTATSPDRNAKVKMLKTADRQTKLVEQVSTIGTAISQLVQSRLEANSSRGVKSSGHTPKQRKIERMVGLLSMEMEELGDKQLSLFFSRK